MVIIRSLWISVMVLVIMITVAHFLGLFGMILLFAATMVLHIWYRRKYGHWMGD